MQRYTIFFVIVDALHVSGGSFAHHQELKNCTHSIWYVPGLLLLPLFSVHHQEHNNCTLGIWHVPDAVCTVLELLMMGRETAQNMYSIDNNKEYCITMHLVGCT
jgi:hypothetical protein